MSNSERVIFLDDDRDLREIIVELFDAFGVPCDAVGSLAELKDVYARQHEFELAILDVNLGPNEPNGIDAYEWLRNRGFRGRIAFLTGHARTHPLIAKASSDGDALVVEKPITSEQLRELVTVRPASGRRAYSRRPG